MRWLVINELRSLRRQYNLYSNCKAVITVDANQPQYEAWRCVAKAWDEKRKQYVYLVIRTKQSLEA